MNNGQLDGLLALKLVAEKRNFRAAAEELGISPSAISQTIKLLEHRLGVALLTRTSRSTRLTEVGEEFLREAGPALEQILRSLGNVGTYAKKPSGILRLNMPRVVFATYLLPTIESFTKKYPEVTFEAFLEDEMTDVVESGFDAGIRSSDILIQDMIAVKIHGPIRHVIAAAPKYLNKMGRPKRPEDLLQHNCIRLRIGKSGFYDRWEFEQKGKEFQVQVKGSLILNDSLSIIDAAIEGAGIFYTVEDAIADKIKSGKLEIILNQFAPSSAGFYLYYPKRSQVQPKLRAFIDHIKNKPVR